jgi:hypothetical protein
MFCQCEQMNESERNLICNTEGCQSQTYIQKITTPQMKFIRTVVRLLMSPAAEEKPSPIYME